MSQQSLCCRFRVAHVLAPSLSYPPSHPHSHPSTHPLTSSLILCLILLHIYHVRCLISPIYANLRQFAPIYANLRQFTPTSPIYANFANLRQFTSVRHLANYAVSINAILRQSTLTTPEFCKKLERPSLYYDKKSLKVPMFPFKP